MVCGPGSSVGIATDYGLDSSGLNPVGDEIFRPSRPALGPTQPPVKWVPVFPGGKVRPGRAADPSSAAVIEEWSYTSTHTLGHTGPVKGSLYLYLYLYNVWFVVGDSSVSLYLLIPQYGYLASLTCFYCFCYMFIIIIIMLSTSN